MPVQSVEEWVGDQRIAVFPLDAIKDAAIGVDASHYLTLKLNREYTAHEPLLGALGGLPFGLKHAIETELRELKAHQISLVFVFNGLDFGRSDYAARSSEAARLAHRTSWDFYDQGNADEVVKAFTRAGYAPEQLYRFLQQILRENDIDFMVAPYNACAQLAWMMKQPTQYIDAVMGSTDLLLYNVEKVVLKFDTDLQRFSWLSLAVCQDRLGNRLTEDTFRDSLLLLGGPYLPTFPPLERMGPKPVSIRDALGFLNSAGRSVIQLCNSYRDDPQFQALEYADRYKKAIMSIRHHVIMDDSGTVAPLDVSRAPGDVHDFIGQRLPEELSFYISRGILDPRVPNWLTSGEMNIFLQPGAEDSEYFRRLLGDQLLPLWTQSLTLLSNSLNRYYQVRTVTLKPWFGNGRAINLKDEPSVKDQLSPWKIAENALPDNVRSQPSFASCLNSLEDSNLVSKTMTKPDSGLILNTQKEIYANVYYRFLRVRGYIDASHKLSIWGKALQSALATSNGKDVSEDTILLCVELLRLGLINDKDMFPSASGAPMRGNDEQKQFSNVIVRVATVGRLKHKSMGYSGPLNRQLLCFSAMISAVRSSLRDLIEVVLTTMLLNGDIERDRRDWIDLGLGLPFINNNNGCGLGILARTYLDELAAYQDGPPPESLKESCKDKVGTWVAHTAGVHKNLTTVFKLWDATYAASQATGKEVKERDLISSANEWLKPRK